MAVVESMPARSPGRPWSLIEAAEFLHVSTKTLTRLADAGRLKLIRIGTSARGRILISDSEVRRLAGC
jgi:excisionase family DNA binding protein